MAAPTDVVNVVEDEDEHGLYYGKWGVGDASKFLAGEYWVQYCPYNAFIDANRFTIVLHPQVLPAAPPGEQRICGVSVTNDSLRQKWLATCDLPPLRVGDWITEKAEKATDRILLVRDTGVYPQTVLSYEGNNLVLMSVPYSEAHKAYRAIIYLLTRTFQEDTQNMSDAFETNAPLDFWTDNDFDYKTMVPDQSSGKGGGAAARTALYHFRTACDTFNNSFDKMSEIEKYLPPILLDFRTRVQGLIDFMEKTVCIQEGAVMQCPPEAKEWYTPTYESAKKFMTLPIPGATLNVTQQLLLAIGYDIHLIDPFVDTFSQAEVAMQNVDTSGLVSFSEDAPVSAQAAPAAKKAVAAKPPATKPLSQLLWKGEARPEFKLVDATGKVNNAKATTIQIVKPGKYQVYCSSTPADQFIVKVNGKSLDHAIPSPSFVKENKKDRLCLYSYFPMLKQGDRIECFCSVEAFKAKEPPKIGLSLVYAPRREKPLLRGSADYCGLLQVGPNRMRIILNPVKQNSDKINGITVWWPEKNIKWVEKLAEPKNKKFFEPLSGFADYRFVKKDQKKPGGPGSSKWEATNNLTLKFQGQWFLLEAQAYGPADKSYEQKLQSAELQSMLSDVATKAKSLLKLSTAIQAGTFKNPDRDVVGEYDDYVDGLGEIDESLKSFNALTKVPPKVVAETTPGIKTMDADMKKVSDSLVVVIKCYGNQVQVGRLTVLQKEFTQFQVTFAKTIDTFQKKLPQQEVKLKWNTDDKVGGPPDLISWVFDPETKDSTLLSLAPEGKTIVIQTPGTYQITCQHEKSDYFSLKRGDQDLSLLTLFATPAKPEKNLIGCTYQLENLKKGERIQCVNPDAKVNKTTPPKISFLKVE